MFALRHNTAQGFFKILKLIAASRFSAPESAAREQLAAQQDASFTEALSGEKKIDPGTMASRDAFADAIAGDNVGNTLRPGRAEPAIASTAEATPFEAGLRKGMKGLQEPPTTGPDTVGFGEGEGKTSNNKDPYELSGNVDYRKVFFDRNPDLKGKVIVHHSIPRYVLKHYPELFEIGEIHEYNNLRGIPRDINNSMHYSEINKRWNQFYKDISNGKIARTRQEFINMAKQIDREFGGYFYPPIH